MQGLQIHPVQVKSNELLTVWPLDDRVEDVVRQFPDVPPLAHALRFAPEHEQSIDAFDPFHSKCILQQPS